MSTSVHKCPQVSTMMIDKKTYANFQACSTMISNITGRQLWTLVDTCGHLWTYSSLLDQYAIDTTPYVKTLILKPLTKISCPFSENKLHLALV